MKTAFARTSLGMVTVLFTMGCATAPPPHSNSRANASPAAASSSESSGGAGEVMTKAAVCGVVAVGAAFAAKLLVAAEARKQKMTPAAAKQRERGYMLGFALLGCGVGSQLGGTLYAKLSEAGKQAREKELVEAANSAKVRTYTDPSNPQLRGRITPGAAYAESGNRECRNMEDVLSEAAAGDPAIIKLCRSLPNGQFAPVTA